MSFGLGWWFCGLLCGGIGFGVMMISRCVVWLFVVGCGGSSFRGFAGFVFALRGGLCDEFWLLVCWLFLVCC